MTTISERLRQDIRTCTKTGDEVSKITAGLLKVILGEIQRLPTKKPSFDDEVRVLKKLEKSETELFKLSAPKQKEDALFFIGLLNMYLPQQVSDEEITNWIKENVYFSRLKNPMQAVGLVMKEFGSKADGKKVKEIVQTFGV